jgi:hypothetical protein
VVAAFLSLALESAQDAFEILISIGAGTGLLYLLRWFWWRINAWSEIAAMVSSFVVAVGFFVAGRQGVEIPAHVSLLVSVAITTAVWLAVTFLTPPTDQSVLVAFYRRVRPAGPGWGPMVRVAGRLAAADSLMPPVLASLFGCAAIYGALFATGACLYGQTGMATIYGAVSLVGIVGVARLLPRVMRAEVPELEFGPATTTGSPTKRQ